MKHIVVYRCQNSGGTQRLLTAPWAREHILSCSGQLEVIHILKAFEQGAAGVYIVRCGPDSCRTLEGSSVAEGRAEHARRLISQVSIEPERIFQSCFKDAEGLEEGLHAFYKSMK
jgi:coenzyme F420-reducing hydrogenase delta subunit